MYVCNHMEEIVTRFLIISSRTVNSNVKITRREKDIQQTLYFILYFIVIAKQHYTRPQKREVTESAGELSLCVY